MYLCRVFQLFSNVLFVVKILEGLKGNDDALEQANSRIAVILNCSSRNKVHERI